MAKYHVNPATGNAGPCSASKAPCPFGGEDQHFASPEAAREAYEASNAAFTPASDGVKDRETAQSVLDSVYNLPDDLEGSVPYVPDYRLAAENFVETVGDQYGASPTTAQVKELAEAWSKDYSDMPSAMMGDHALAELKRLQA